MSRIEASGASTGRVGRRHHTFECLIDRGRPWESLKVVIRHAHAVQSTIQWEIGVTVVRIGFAIGHHSEGTMYMQMTLSQETLYMQMTLSQENMLMTAGTRATPSPPPTRDSQTPVSTDNPLPTIDSHHHILGQASQGIQY